MDPQLELTGHSSELRPNVISGDLPNLDPVVVEAFLRDQADPHENWQIPESSVERTTLRNHVPFHGLEGGRGWRENNGAHDAIDHLQALSTDSEHGADFLGLDYCTDAFSVCSSPWSKLSLEEEKLPANEDFFLCVDSLGSSSLDTPKAEQAAQDISKSVREEDSQAGALRYGDFDELEHQKSCRKNKCQICEAPASRHSHYGAQACKSCRAFFRRSVAVGSHKNFYCYTGKQKCSVVGVKARKSCQFCRFQKCLASGMRQSWVISGENNAVSELESEKMIARPILNVELTLEEMSLLSLIEATVITNAMKATGRYLDSNPAFAVTLASARHLNYHHLTHRDFVHFRQMFDVYLTGLMSVWDGFASMPHEDKKQFMRVNGKMVQNLKRSLSLSEMVDLICESEEDDSGRMKELCHSMAQMGVEKATVLPCRRYFPANWARDSRDEERHDFILSKMSQWPRNGSAQQPQHIDRSMFVLLELVLAFSTDFVSGVELRVKEAMEREQVKYLCLLHRYLRFKYSENSDLANAKMADGIALISYAKEALDIQRRGSGILTC